MEKSGVICARAAQEIAARCAVGGVVALYANKGSEVETVALDRELRERGFRVAYPRVVDAARVLVFAEVVIEALVSTRWGLREPAIDAATIGVEEIGVFVLPGLAFDRAGGRVGWGKGHYDATLAASHLDSLAIGIAFECQVVESVPREAHDILLDLIVTEESTYVVDGE